MEASRFQALLAEVKAKAKLRREQEAASLLSAKIDATGVVEVDLTLAGVSTSSSVEIQEEVARELITTTISASKAPTRIGVAREDITLNEKQLLFNTTVLAGNSCVLIGAAGTGKTTSMRRVTRDLIDTGHLSKLQTGTKYLKQDNYGAAVVSFTRKAVNNIRHAVVEELKSHTITVHKLLEFAPEFYEIEDPNNPGYFKNTMRFIPTRTAFNPLPRELTFIAFEESSMISVELYTLLQNAMPHPHQEVFIGDIQQLPPVFGQAILGHKMLELPVVELTEIYRQAAESPIINLAWSILSGDATKFLPTVMKYKTEEGKDRNKFPVLEKFNKKVTLPGGEESEVKFQVWQKPLSVDHALITILAQLRKWEEQGYYNPTEDIILCPFNKGFGTVEINKGISNYLGRKRNAEVQEVIAGYNKHYLSVGDRVLYDKEDAFITAIRRNGRYLGKPTQPASTKLDRWGHLQVEELTEQDVYQLNTQKEKEDSFSLEAMDDFMNSAASDVTERVQVASHIIEIRYAYSEEWEEPVVLESAAEINNLLGGYCITVHKFQGSEAEKVFLLYHNSHHAGVIMSREAIYTAVTRAKKHLHIICERDSFYKAIKCQAIKGNTLAEKAEWFKGKKIT